VVLTNAPVGLSLQHGFVRLRKIQMCSILSYGVNVEGQLWSAPSSRFLCQLDYTIPMSSMNLLIPFEELISMLQPFSADATVLVVAFGQCCVVQLQT
jgi:hypothetical protein